MARLFFFLWLAGALIPYPLQQYQPFAALARLGQFTEPLALVLAVAALIIPMLPAKAAPTPTADVHTLIIHDLEPAAAVELFGSLPNTKIFCAARNSVTCKGFCDCWLKTPGLCTFHDGLEVLGPEISRCDRLVIISRSLYGGFSIDVKTALDRSISYLMPFFSVRSREQHHQGRYPRRGGMEVYIYDSDTVSDSDRASLERIALANSLNFDKAAPEVHFVSQLADLKVVTV